MLCNLRTRALLIVFACLMCACSADKQTDDPPTYIHHIIPPPDPCDPFAKERAPLETDSIEVGIVTESTDPNSYEMYVNVKLTMIAGEFVDDTFTCQYTRFWRQPSQNITVFVHPSATLPDGVFEITAYLFSDSYDAEWCITEKAKHTKPLTDRYYKKGFAECGPRVIIQYDCMSSYDIRYRTDLLRRLNDVLGEDPIYDTIAFRVDQTTLPNQTFQTYQAFRDFIHANWEVAFLSQTDSVQLYLGAIEDIDRSSGAFPGLGNAAGVSDGFGGEPGGLGEVGAYTIVFVKYIRANFDSKDHKDLILRCATHELGHARAALTHASDSTSYLHQSNFKCVMIRSLDVRQPGSNDIDHDYYRFCYDCRLKISTLPW